MVLCSPQELGQKYLEAGRLDLEVDSREEAGWKEGRCQVEEQVVAGWPSWPSPAASRPSAAAAASVVQP